MTQPGFSSKQIQKLTGINHRQLVYMCDLGAVVPGISDANGKGSRRRFDESSIFQVLFMMTLRKSSIEFRHCTRWTKAICQHWDYEKEYRNPTGFVEFQIFDGRYGFILKDGVVEAAFTLKDTGESSSLGFGEYDYRASNFYVKVIVRLHKILHTVKSITS